MALKYHLSQFTDASWKVQEFNLIFILHQFYTQRVVICLGDHENRFSYWFQHTMVSPIFTLKRDFTVCANLPFSSWFTNSLERISSYHVMEKFTFPSEASLAESPTCLLWFLGQTKDGVDSFILVVYGVVAVLGEIEVIRSPPLFLSPALDESWSEVTSPDASIFSRNWSGISCCCRDQIDSLNHILLNLYRIHPDWGKAKLIGYSGQVGEKRLRYSKPTWINLPLCNHCTILTGNPDLIRHSILAGNPTSIRWARG